MRNLVLLTDRRRGVEGVSTTRPEVVSITTKSWEGATFLLVGNTGELLAYDEDDVLLWATALPPQRRWISCTYIGELDAIVCVAAEGDMVSVAATTSEQEVLGTVDAGVRAASWSPDQEVLVLVTGSHTAMAMSTDMEVLHEVPLPGQGVVGEEGAKTAVAWRGDGKYLAILCVEEEEGGKAARRVRVYERDGLQFHSLGRREDGQPIGELGRSLAWSTDGSLIAATQRVKDTQLQVVFFERNGLRHREFLLPPGLVDAGRQRVDFLQWNVETDLLLVGINDTSVEGGGSQLQLWHRDNYHWYLKHHRAFDRPLTHAAFDPERPYHLSAALQGSPYWCDVSVCWDVCVSPSLLNMAAVIDGTDLHLTPLSRALVPPPMSHNKLSSSDPSDPFIAAASLPHDPSQPHAPPLLSAALSSRGRLHLYDEQQAAARPGGEGGLPALVTVDVTDALGLCTPRQLVLLSSTLAGDGEASAALLLLAWEPASAREVLVEVSATPAGASIAHTLHVPPGPPVLRLANWGTTPGAALVETGDGHVYRYQSGLLLPFKTPLLEPCPWVSLMQLTPPGQESKGGEEGDEDEWSVVLGLSGRQRLYFGEQLLCNAASGFAASPWHACVGYVTAGTRPDLRFVSYRALRGAMDVLHGGVESSLLLTPLQPRAVERGMRLVALLAGQPRVVLQAARGNLEGTYPRVLVLRTARRWLDQGRFADVFDLLRRQRVDLNLLVDHRPRLFVREAGRFVEQLSSAHDHLNLFISSLSNHDCTAPGASCHDPEGGDEPAKPQEEEEGDLSAWFPLDKPNRICQLLRQAMTERLGVPSALRPILTTYARQSPPQLEEALLLIRQQCREVWRERLSGERCQRTLKYLSFFADFSRLYDVALGLYDLDLVRAVARQSQKDPREYGGFLDGLQAMEEWRARVAIDKHLHRPERALRHLASRREEEVEAEECLELIDGSGLHELALSLFTHDAFPLLRRRLVSRWAEALEARGAHRQAMLAHLSNRPPDLQRAALAAKQGGEWRMALALLAQWTQARGEAAAAGEGPSVEGWARQMAGSLRDHMGPQRRERLKDAAHLMEHYLHDVEAAALALTAGRHWSEALSLCWRSARQDLIETDVKAGMLDAADALEDAVDTWRQGYPEAVAGVEAVMGKRRARMDEEEEKRREAGDGGEDSASVFSAVTGLTDGSVRSSLSSASGVSASSLRSGLSLITMESKPLSQLRRRGRKEEKREKQRRTKSERRRPSLKEQEDALRAELAVMLPTREWLEEVRDLLQALVVVGEGGRALSLQRCVEAHIHLCASLPVPAPDPLLDPPQPPPRIMALAESVDWKGGLPTTTITTSSKASSRSP